AGRGRRRRGQVRAEGRPAGDGGNHRGGARGGGALFPVLPRERELSRAHLRLRCPSRHRKSPQGNGVRAGGRARGLEGAAAPLEGACARCVARGAGAEAPDAVRSADGARTSRADTHMSGHHWVRLASCDSIPPREGREVLVDGCHIAVFNLGDRFFATGNRCPHRGGPLCDGIVTGAAVVCPLHAWKVNLATGTVERPEGVNACVQTYPIRVEDEVILLGLPRAEMDGGGDG